ncbi:carbonic anhydrase [Legionella yabuuchiae]|uniref:carbonic anhydrase n=1 Tax=Legionella yabuuchiae TaxID=376727 RepID=UPI001055C83D|nr:carbonic anhydrase [Legionella yabuuchiae]
MYRAGQGNTKFRESIKSPEKCRFFKSLEEGQNPNAWLLTCCDSRVVPSQFTETKPGELFIHRNVGNIISPEPTEAEIKVTIEYALKYLEVGEIIVCGHTDCGAMKALINPEMVEDSPIIRQYLKHASPVLEKIKDIRDPRQKLQKAIEENVLLQIEHLKTHPRVKEALEAGSIKIHGFVYHIGTGELHAYDPTQEKFVLIDECAEFKTLHSAAHA